MGAIPLQLTKARCYVAYCRRKWKCFCRSISKTVCRKMEFFPCFSIYGVYLV